MWRSMEKEIYLNAKTQKRNDASRQNVSAGTMTSERKCRGNKMRSHHFFLRLCVFAFLPYHRTYAHDFYAERRDFQYTPSTMVFSIASNGRTSPTPSQR